MKFEIFGFILLLMLVLLWYYPEETAKKLGTFVDVYNKTITLKKDEENDR